MTRPSRTPELVASACFLAAGAAAAGFVVAFITENSPQLEGLLLGGACVALALGLIVWAMHLLPSGTYVEERPPMQPLAEVEKEFQSTLQRGGRQTPGLLRRTLMLAGLGLGVAAIVPLRSLLPSGRGPYAALQQTAWRRGVRMMTSEGKLVRLDEVVPGTALTVFPEAPQPQDDATVILLRLDPAALEQSHHGAAGSVDGCVAFSKLCTHAGCPVGLYEQTSQELFCPCHQSAFDVREGARPIAGPAPRPLPQLPLAVDSDGYLQADGTFSGQVGPTYWRRG